MTDHEYEKVTTGEPVRVIPTIPHEEISLGELFSQLASDMSTLVRKEIELARAETQEKISLATGSVVTMAAGGLVAYAGLIVLLAALAIWLTNYMDAWLAALIVGAGVIAVGIVLITIGRSALANLSVVPERTIENIKQDARWAKEQIQ